MSQYYILAINPGSTSTKIAVYENEKPLFVSSLDHTAEELAKCPSQKEQFFMRKDIVLNELKKQNFPLEKLSAVVGRGGQISPLKAGGYYVNEAMKRRIIQGPIIAHASNLGALLAAAVATTAGAVLGTSTTTTFVESASGVTEGGRTGLTAITTAILFGLSLFLSPIFLAIPSFATAPALVIVGFYMLGAVTDIDFTDPAEGIPAFICIAAMPFFYSISEGISMGVISYVLLNLLTGKGKKVSPVMYVLAVLFILKYILI